MYKVQISHMINFVFACFLLFLLLCFFAIHQGPNCHLLTIWLDCPEIFFHGPLALPVTWQRFSVNGHLALSHTGNTQNPQNFLWGAREPETVAGRCPMCMMAKITHTRMHTSYTQLHNAVKDEVVFNLFQWSEPSVSHKHYWGSVKQTDTLSFYFKQ